MPYTVDCIANNRLLIVGASGHGKVVADIAISTGSYREIAFLDDDESIRECMGFHVLGSTGKLADFVADYEMVVAIGNAQIRQRIMNQIDAVNGKIATLVHPKAVISRYAKIGEGTVVMPGAVINADAMIGRGCIINTAATVDHECRISNYVHVSVGAHLAGSVVVGERSWVGIGAVVSNNVTVCADCMIGAGAVVVNEISKPGTYIGIPARLQVNNSKGKQNS